MIIYKNFLQITAKKKIMIILYSVIFFLTVFISSSNLEIEKSKFKETCLTVIVIDKDNSNLSKNLIKYLKTKNNILENTKLQNMEEDKILNFIKREISIGSIDAGIIINTDLENNLSKGINCITCLQDDRNKTSFYINIQIQKFLLFAENIKKSEEDFNFEKIHEALNQVINVQTIYSKKNTDTGRWFKFFFNLFAWFLFSIILNTIGRAIFLLKAPSIKKRNDISPISTIRFSIEIFFAQLTIVVLILCIVICTAVLFKIKEIESIPILIYTFNCITYSAVILSITFMLNAILRKGAVLSILGTILPLALSFISGVFVPIEFISNNVLNIAKFFPTFYFIQANEFTSSFLKIDWKNISMLFLFFVLYFLAGLYFTTKKRSQTKIEVEQQ